VKTCNSADTNVPEECAALTFLVEDALSLIIEASISSEIFLHMYKPTWRLIKKQESLLYLFI
jgi:hypothetical protein